MSTTVPSADAKAVVRAVEALTTQVGRIAKLLSTPVVEYEVAEADAPTTPRPSLAALDVQGFCPACGHGVLMLGEGGHVTCTLIDCPNPCAADDLLHAKATTPDDGPRCVCGDPIEQTGDPARWVHRPTPGKVAHTVRPAIDRCEHRGPHPGFTCAEVDASQPYFRVRWEQEQQAPADDGPDFTSPLAGRIEVRRPCPYCGDRQMIPTHQYDEHVARLHPDVRTGGPGIPVPPADEDQALRWARRESLLVLLTRVQHGRTLTDDEARTLRHHIETEMSEAETARTEARRLGLMVDEYSGGARHLSDLLRTETARANAAIDRETAAEEAAEEQRRRADIAELELRTLRTGLRAAGGDPTQIQNLWAQISLRNRQWRETKRELRVTRSMLEEEGGDVSLVDEMISTVAKAEQDAREAQQKLSDSETLGHKVLKRAERAEDTIKQARAAARWIRRNYPGMTQAHDRLAAALDGTEQQQED